MSKVEQDRVRSAEADPNDSGYASQWSLAKIGWTNVFGSVTPSGSAVVALLDTGVDGSHSDLAGQLVPGTSILDGSSGTFDPNGHGTAMAGIIAALTDNGQGIAGVRYAGVKVMPITVLDAQGLGQDSDIILGVVWAVQHGADVINMSFSNPGFSTALQAAIDYAWANDVVVVAATGNDGSTSATFPAGDRGVIGVSNTNQNDNLNPSSNSGADTFLGAPGTDITTLNVGGGTTSVTGTSAS
nr:S8 family serine peptidase [Chloroflexota bacterium]